MTVVSINLHFDDITAFLDGFAKGIAQNELYEVLEFCVDVSTDCVHKYSLHAGHQELQPLDHSDHLDDGKLLIACVVVSNRLGKVKSTQKISRL